MHFGFHGGLALFYLKRRGQPAVQETLVLQIRDKVILGGTMGLVTLILGAINYNVNYLARVVPMKLQEHEQRIGRAEETVKELVRDQKEDVVTRGRMLGIMERMELRFRAMEGDR